jgi:hypothetical protein
MDKSLLKSFEKETDYNKLKHCSCSVVDRAEDRENERLFQET